MLNTPLCFVDLETTGFNSYQNRIIEIGILKVQNNRVIREYNQLINPQTGIDQFIKNLTGINQEQLDSAPTFAKVANEVIDILSGSIFIAHNVRFDYGFLKREFKNIGYTFREKHFCTVRLARLLFPELGHYNLDSIFKNFQIKCANRHRAFDDAKVLWEFYKKAERKVEGSIFKESLTRVLKKSTLPMNLKESDLENIPDTPGVYIFYGDDHTPLYIGKSVNLYDRVHSHFANDYMSSTDMKITQQVKRIEILKTAGELGALLTEANLIKTLQPLYNRMLRHSQKSIVHLKTTNEQGFYTYQQKFLNDLNINELDKVIGLYKSPKQAVDRLRNIAKENNLCLKHLKLEKTNKACFYTHLGICNGACANRENYLKYNLRFDKAFYKQRVKPWNFEKPILIKEESETQEYFVVDKWCFLGSIKNENETLEDLNREYSFDLDTYKILSKYVFDPKNSHKISQLTRN